MRRVFSRNLDESHSEPFISSTEGNKFVPDVIWSVADDESFVTEAIASAIDHIKSVVENNKSVPDDASSADETMN